MHAGKNTLKVTVQDMLPKYLDASGKFEIRSKCKCDLISKGENGCAGT